MIHDMLFFIPINGEEEWVVEEILNSRMMNRKPCYLVNTLEQLATSEPVISMPFHSAPLHPQQCWDITPLKGGG